jgi:hypothetical protein
MTSNASLCLPPGVLSNVYVLCECVMCLAGGILDRMQGQNWAQRDVLTALKRTALVRAGEGMLAHILKAPTDMCALERLGFKPKAKMYTTWTAAHKQRLKPAPEAWTHSARAGHRSDADADHGRDVLSVAPRHE